jgi:polyisoprenoid-binding protein YceI
MVFTSSKTTPKGENQYDVEGALTIRGVTKPVTVRVTGKADEFEGRAPLSLKDFGLKPPASSLSLGLIGTKDSMTVLFHLRKER